MTSSEVRIVPVTTEKQRAAFVKFPWALYRDDPNWVPPIYGDKLKLLDPQRHPFWEHGELQLFLAVRDQEVVGTISAHINRLHNEVYKDKLGFFGFFDVVEDFAVAEALFDAAAGWLRQRGMEAMRGPENPSQNEEVGLLIDGFDRPPVVMMTYNPRYYQDFIERAGFEKAQDLYAWDLLTDIFEKDVKRLPRKFLSVAEKAKSRDNVVIRRIDMKHFDDEVALAKIIYSQAWEQNWGFVPMTSHEFEHMGQELKMIMDPDLVYVAEVNGQPAGIILGIPDVYQALIRARPQPNNWSLYPLTVPKLLWYQRKVDTYRVLIMGVVPEYRMLGLEAAMIVEVARASFRSGYEHCEMSWILESNDMMNRIIERLGGEVYKTYRVYEKPI